jgi:predicted ATPase
MKLEKLHIKNFKSLVDLEIIKPNPFTVFAGPNGSGKSNIFEALEFMLWPEKDTRLRVFGWGDNLQNRSIDTNSYELTIRSDEFNFEIEGEYFFSNQFEEFGPMTLTEKFQEFDTFLKSFSRYFIGSSDYQKINYNDSFKLNFSCSNLEKVLKRLLEKETKREDITEYLEMFIPGLHRVVIDSNNLSGTDTLLIYEKGIKKPFTKDLISDGTYNILCLLTALFQSDEPQFLCIEEPENGLNPYVVQEFVELCRLMCEGHGHYIWLNTHSQTLVRMLKEEELILVDKENGATKIKQFEKGDFHGLKADEAWLTNSLGAGIPW